VAAVGAAFQARRAGRLRVLELASDLSQALGHGLAATGPGSSESRAGGGSGSFRGRAAAAAAGAVCASRDALLGTLPAWAKSRVFDASLRWSLGTSPSLGALLLGNRPWVPPAGADARDLAAAPLK
jgi:hypothetical protein